MVARMKRSACIAHAAALQRCCLFHFTAETTRSSQHDGLLNTRISRGWIGSRRMSRMSQVSGSLYMHLFANTHCLQYTTKHSLCFENQTKSIGFPRIRARLFWRSGLECQWSQKISFRVKIKVKYVFYLLSNNSRLSNYNL